MRPCSAGNIILDVLAFLVPGSTQFLKHFQDLKKQQKIQKYDVVYYTLCRVYRDPDGPRKENEVSEPSKGGMIEHEQGEFIIYHYQLKEDQARINRAYFQDLMDTSRTFLRFLNQLNPPHTLVSPYFQDTTLNLHRLAQGPLSALFKVFHHSSPPPPPHPRISAHFKGFYH